MDATPFDVLWQEGIAGDSFPQEVLAMLENGTVQTKKISLAECSNDQGQLRFRNALYIPDHAPLTLQIIKLHHDKPAAGHSGRAKTFNLISIEFFWPKLRQYIE